MTVHSVGSHSTIWSNATTALAKTPDAKGFAAPKANDASIAGAAKATQQPNGATTPFQQLSSDLQAVMLKMQSAKG